MQLKDKLIINASAEKVWGVLAHEFANIGQWATAIAASHENVEANIPDGASCGGRVCNVPSFGSVHESFTHYDEAAKQYGYQATQGLPSFVLKAENNWHVVEIGPNKTEASYQAEVTLKPFIGLFMGPIFKWQINRLIPQTLEELKYFIEHDEPHPRKQKQLEKMMAKV